MYLVYESDKWQYFLSFCSFFSPPDTWKDISYKAINLIGNLLQVKSRKRHTVEKSIIDPWLDDYEVYCDLRRLEAKLGVRWLTHESDEDRWDNYRIMKNLPINDFGSIRTSHRDESSNEEENRDKFTARGSFRQRAHAYEQADVNNRNLNGVRQAAASNGNASNGTSLGPQAYSSQNSGTVNSRL